MQWAFSRLISYEPSQPGCSRPRWRLWCNQQAVDGATITAPPPGFRGSGPAPVAFTSLDAAGGMPQVFAMQDATSGTVRVRPGETTANVTLDAAMSSNKYQAIVTPRFNAGGVWVPTPDRTTGGFVIMWEKPAPEGGELDWEVRAAPWPGNPTPLCCTDSVGEA